MRYTFLLLLYIFIFQYVKAQNAGLQIPDSLQDKDYEYLEDKMYLCKKDNAKAAIYLFTYLHKAKNEHN